LHLWLESSYSTDPKIGNKFKCWIYNAAANSAMQLRESIMIGLADMNNDNKAMLSAFADTAILDAQMYLNYSEDHDKSSVLTQYNKACIDILSGNENKKQFGIKTLMSIPPPNLDDSSAADLSWHIDNYDSFFRDSFNIKSAIESVDGADAVLIERRLFDNSNLANNIKNNRSDMWTQVDKSNKSLIVYTMVGCAIAGIAVASPEALSAIKDLIVSTHEIFAATGDAGVGLATTGDGGIGIADMGSVNDLKNHLTRAAFGDGGIGIA